MPAYRKFRANDWPLYVEEVHALYIGQRKPVKELIEHFRDRYGFEVTDDQFKKLFQKQRAGPNGVAWSKNLTTGEWQAIDRLVDERNKEGKPSQLVRNGREYDDQTLHRDRRRARRRVRPARVTVTLSACVGTPPASATSPLPAGRGGWPLIYGPPRLGRPMCDEAPDHHSPDYSSLINWSPDVMTSEPEDRTTRELSPESMSMLAMGDAVWSRSHASYSDVLLSAKLRTDYLYGPDCYDVIAQLERMEQADALGHLFPQKPAPCPAISHAWSIEGLRQIAAAVSSSKFLSSRLGHRIPDIHRATPADLLDLALSSMKCFRLFAEDDAPMDLAAGPLLFEWFADPQHRPLFAMLGRAKTKMLHGFVDCWAEFSNLLISWEERQKDDDEEGDNWQAMVERHANAILAIVEWAPDPIITESSCSSLLETAMKANSTGEKLCRQVLRRLPDSDWIVPGDLSLTISCGSPAVFEALLEAKTSSWRRQLASASGDCESMIGEMSSCSRRMAHELLFLGKEGADSRIAAAIVAFCKETPVADPCWAGLDIMDIVEFLFPDCVSIGPDETSAGPVVQIARAARAGGAAGVELLRSHSHASEYDLQLALMGATVTRCADVVRTLLRAGVDPNTPLLVSAQREEQRRGHRCRRDQAYVHRCFLCRAPLELQVHSLPMVGNGKENAQISCLLINYGATMTSRNVWVMQNVFSHIPWDDVVDTLRRRPDMVADYGSVLVCLAFSHVSAQPAVLSRLLEWLPSEIVNTPVFFGNYRNPRTPIQQAILGASFENFKLLWGRGGRLEPVPEGSKRTGGLELTLALARFAWDSAAKVRFLLEHGATADCEVAATYEVTSHDKRPAVLRTTPLIAMLKWAACSYHRDDLEETPGLLGMLLNAGADPNRLVCGSLSPIELACGVGMLSMVRMLLGAGAKIQPGSHPVRSLVQGTEYLTAHRPSRSFHVDPELLRLVIQACRDAEVDMRVDLSTALIVAAASGRVDVATVLLEAGADPGYFGPTLVYTPWENTPSTALEAAATGGCLEMVQLLIEAETIEAPLNLGVAGGDGQGMASHGRLSSALEVAENWDHYDVVEVLERQLANFAPFAPEADESVVDVDFALGLPASKL